MTINTSVTHDEILKQIREWLDSVSIAHTIRPKDQTQDQFNFIIDLANPLGVTIFINKTMPDRLIFSGSWNFGPQHKEAGKQLEPKKFYEMITNFIDKFITYDVEWNFDANGQEINSISVFKFVYLDAISKDRFFQKLTKINNVHFQLLRLINSYLDISLDNSSFKTSENTKSSPYS